MTDTNPILTSKELSNILKVTLRTAKKYLSEMKSHYNPKSNKITMSHYYDYFNIPVQKSEKKA